MDGAYPPGLCSCTSSPKNMPGSSLYTTSAAAPAAAALRSLSEKYTSAPPSPPPRSASTIEPAASSPARPMSASVAWPANTMRPATGSSGSGAPTIGTAPYVEPPCSTAATRPAVTLLYVAPTVITLGFLPGLPMLPAPGPSFPAAATTTTPLATARLTSASMLSLVWLTPRLMLTTSAPSATAPLTARMMRSGETDRPSPETLYETISERGAMPRRAPPAAMTPATPVPWPSASTAGPAPSRLRDPTTLEPPAAPPLPSAKSGWNESTPVSMTATVIPLPPPPPPAPAGAPPPPTYGTLFSTAFEGRPPPACGPCAWSAPAVPAAQAAAAAAAAKASTARPGARPMPGAPARLLLTGYSGGPGSTAPAAVQFLGWARICARTLHF